MTSDRDWPAIAKRNSRSVQTLIGWIFWDPGALARYAECGVPFPGAGYIATRAAPMAAAGAAAVTYAFGSISPEGIAMVFAALATTDRFHELWAARNEAVREGLTRYAPEAMAPLATFGELLAEVLDELPIEGCPFTASHRSLEIPDDAVLRGWHAVNYLREWRGDVHWNITRECDLSPAEASVLHNAWLNYEGDWLSLSRGNSPASIDAAWESLTGRGLAKDRVVTTDGIALRQWIEDETDRRTTLPWELLGPTASDDFARLFEPPCVALLERVDITAGPNYQPASRIH